MDANELAANRIGSLLKRQRAKRRLTLERAAEEIGVSASTLSRWERRGTAGTARIPRQFDLQTYQKIARWLEEDQGVVLNVGEPLLHPAHEEMELSNTPDVIEAHLRADRHLDSQGADLLSELVRTAYARLSSDGTINVIRKKED